MYEEGNRKRINWGSFLIKLVLLVLIVFLACWIYIRVTNNSSTTSTLADNSDYINNITTMKNAGLEYFTSSKLPDEIGESSKVTLRSMISQKLLIDFTNDGETCDLDESYIQATKTSDGNYALKVSLTCGETEDFIVTTIEGSKNSNITADASITNSDVVVDSTDTDTTTTTTDSSSNNNTSSSNSSSSSSSSNSSSSSSNSSSGSNTTTSSGSTTTTTTTVKTTVTTTVNIKITGSCSSSCCYTTCCTSNCNTTTDDKTDDTPTKTTTRYYKYVKYSDWEEGYLEGAENKEITNTTAKYCKVKTKTYYTTSYLHYQSSAMSYSYNYALDLSTSNADNVSITNYAYFTTADYSTFLNLSNWKLYSTSGVATNNISITSASSFEASSLKKSNFTFTVNNLTTSNSYYTASINVNYLNGLCVTPYYVGDCNNCVFFAPVKFTVKYTDLTDCVTDDTSYAYKYSGYTAYDTTTTSTWYHRTATYTWSTETSLEGYTYTGIYEDR